MSPCFSPFGHISIHSLRMEGDYSYNFHNRRRDISIHSLRMEGDVLFTKVPAASELFQSTPSAWRETEQKSELDKLKTISIHSLRMEGDKQAVCSAL